MLHNDSLIYQRRYMILATLRNSVNALNKIIIYRLGLSPVCAHVALHCVLSWFSPRALSLTQTQATVQKYFRLSRLPFLRPQVPACSKDRYLGYSYSWILHFRSFLLSALSSLFSSWISTCLSLWKFRRLLVFLSILILIHVVLILGFSLFWDLTQRRMVVCYRNFGTIYRSHLQGSSRYSSWTAWSLKMGPIGCPKTSVSNYQSALSTILEGQMSHIRDRASLGSRIVLSSFILSLYILCVTARFKCCHCETRSYKCHLANAREDSSPALSCRRFLFSVNSLQNLTCEENTKILIPNTKLLV